MRRNQMRVRGALLARLATAAATGILVAACSMDVTRFDSNPFNNRQDVTNSVPPQQPNPAQVPGHQLPQRNQVETQPLNTPPAGANYRPNTVPAATAPQMTPRQMQGPQTTSSVNGPGTAITVQRGETVYSLSRRHNVPVDALLRANNLTAASSLRIGQRLVIPGRGQAAISPNQGPARAAGSHQVRSGETLFSLSRRYKVSPQAIASANNLTLTTQLRIGQQVRIPGTGSAVANAPQSIPANPPARRTAVVNPPANANPPIVNATANNEAAPQPETVGVVRPAIAPSVNPEPQAAPNAAPSFRWPVRGRIISAFGRKPNGQQNDGINLSVPEGTPIRAAEDGVVAYAGNELKGFGNLVLIRHADNWVTAYAHTSAIDVRKDQKVKRGDVIARAGATGGVTAPQLHFEIRKGSNPVDPEKHLAGS